jgi:hypothetical protein
MGTTVAVCARKERREREKRKGMRICCGGAILTGAQTTMVAAIEATAAKKGATARLLDGAARGLRCTRAPARGPVAA